MRHAALNISLKNPEADKMRAEFEILDYLKEINEKIDELSGNGRVPSKGEMIILRDMKIRRATLNWILSSDSEKQISETDCSKKVTLKGLW